MANRQLPYLIESGGYYKIGVSADVNKRIETLQTSSPHTVECVAYYLTKQSAVVVEKELHKLFAKYRMRGEWFDFEQRFTQEAFDSLCDKYGMTKLDFLEDGKCSAIEEPKKLKVKKPFGSVPDSDGIKIGGDDSEHWRKVYGIKARPKGPGF